MEGFGSDIDTGTTAPPSRKRVAERPANSPREDATDHRALSCKRGVKAGKRGDVEASAPDAADLPEGPTTYEETFMYADTLFETLAHEFNRRGKDINESLAQLADKQIILTTSYSGIGSAEWSLKFVQKAFQKRGCNVDITFYCAGDIDEQCRKLLLSHRERPRHVFGNLVHRMPTNAVQEVMELQAQYRNKLPPRTKYNKSERARLAKTLGEEFFQHACDVLGKVELGENTTMWCYACEAHCKVCPDMTEGAIWIECAGNTCTPWSSAGELLGWLDEASVASLIWGYSLRAAGQSPHHIVNECTPRWPAEHFFAKTLGRYYRQVSISVCPSSLGLPCRRPRLYTILSLEQSTSSPFPLDDIFHTCTSKRICCDANIYFRAPPDVMTSAMRTTLSRRKLQEPAEGLRGVNLLALETIACRRRFEEFRVHFEETYGKDSVVTAVADVSQNLSFCKPLHGHVPTLRRNSVIINIGGRRMMLPVEHFCVNGVPLWSGVDEDLMQLPVEAFLQLSERVARQLAGNMMHLAVVGSILEMTLLCSNIKE